MFFIVIIQAVVLSKRTHARHKSCLGILYCGSVSIDQSVILDLLKTKSLTWTKGYSLSLWIDIIYVNKCFIFHFVTCILNCNEFKSDPDQPALCSVPYFVMCFVPLVPHYALHTGAK